MGRFAPTPFVAVAVLTGCGASVPLGEVPIIGGTPAEREIARNTMLAFDQEVGPGRVELDSLTFGDPGGEVVGRCRGDRIVIRPGLDERAVARVVRHELCHALDFAESLSDTAPKALNDLLFVVEPLDVPSDEAETLAVYCELGSFPARALADPCPEDDPRITAMAGWLVDTIWTASDPGYTLEPSEASREVDADLDLVTMYGSLFDSAAARLEYTTTAEPDVANVMSISLDLGALGPDIWSVAYIASHDEIGNPPLYDWNMVSLSIDAVTYDRQAIFALEDGTASGFYMHLGWDPMYLSAPRASLFDGEAWHNVSGSCVRPGQGVFATSDGTFWSSWIEGNTVRWGSFVPVD